MNLAPLTSYQVADLEGILGHSLSAAELAHYNSQHSDEYGYFLMDPRPRGNRKLLLLWSGCWGRAILHYMQHYRQELLEIYSPLIVIDYGLVLSVTRDHKFPLPELVRDAWAAADAVIFSPIGACYGELSSEFLLRFVKPECKTASFTGPSQGCWWPICPLVGEHGAHALMAQGLSDDQIWQRFAVGTFDSKFEVRFAEQRAWLKGKQSFGSVRLSEFLERHYLNHKLFFTFNHPTYPVTTFCAESCFGILGEATKPEEFVLSLPIDAYMVGDIMPETHYEWDYYKFTYPMRYTSTWGGVEPYYRRLITEARTRWKP
jgi:hypothetical protein